MAAIGRGSMIPRLMYAVLIVSVCASLIGCSGQPGGPSGASSATEDPILAAKGAALSTYLNSTFGTGGGGSAVPWYSSIKSVKYFADDHIVVNTTLSRDQAQDVKSVFMAVSGYPERPQSSIVIEVRDSNGTDLVPLVDR
jgi:hypothetical protein